MKSGIYFIVFICCWQMSLLCVHAQIQVAPDRYRVEFTDKKHNVYTINQPEFFLSQRALQRRARQGISVTEADLPVSACYIDSLKQMGFEVLNNSRWFNSAIIRSSPENLEKLEHFNFIKHHPVIQKERVQDTTVDDDDFFVFHFKRKNEPDSASKYAASAQYYGQAADQVGMMNGQALHNRGFRGKGKLIAVIDGGFYKVMELSGFDSLRNSGRLREMKNFTPEINDNSEENGHGANVLSIIASHLQGRMMGTAPDAEFVLLRSEESDSEYIVEEDNWVTAVEYADSIGVDLITTSLGYTTFDERSQNHCYQELDGRAARASQAATMAAARGIIVCVSAGNDGDTRWKYVSVPADADSVVTVGAVDRNGRYVSFSSHGHTADNRIKPDLTAMGKETAYQNSMGNINTGNGTSYSTPLLAGLMACLWQAFPDSGNMEIIEMVKRSASHFNEPDSLYGYGIPDFSKPMQSSFLLPAAKNESYAVSVLPDPRTETCTLFLSPARHGRVRILIKTPSGQQVFSHSAYVSGYDMYELPIKDVTNFASGLYLIDVRTDAGKIVAKMNSFGF